MSDLISRQAAIDMFQNLAYDDWNQGAGTTWANAFAESADMIEELPSAEVTLCHLDSPCEYQNADIVMPSAQSERKMGKWIKLYAGNYICSVCGAWWGNDDNEMVEDFKYCPNCGARMEQ